MRAAIFNSIVYIVNVSNRFLNPQKYLPFFANNYNYLNKAVLIANVQNSS